jgi:hypothetical protein
VYSTSGNGIYIQDAQLEAGLVATDYIETGATTAQAGILEDMPRIDYTNSSSPALLLEPQRTNSIEQSEYLNTWNTIVNMTIDVNQGTSPEGHDNATKLLPTTFNGEHFIDRGGFSRTAGEYISHTIYAKADGYNYLYISNAASRLYGVYNLSNGSVEYVNSNGTDFTNHSANIEDVGNGWYRCALIGQALTSVATYMRISCAPVAVDSQGYNFAGDGTSGVLVYGAQAETNSSYPTSYIPTYGTAVTRSADEVTHLTTTSLLSQTTNNTIYGEITNFKEQAGNARFISLFNSSFSNTDRILIYSSHTGSDYTLNAQYKTSGQSDVNIAISGMSYNERVKFAVVFDGTEMSLFVNGSLVGSSTIVAANNFYHYDPTNIPDDLGFRGHQVSLFPTALTDAECIALTTL